MFTVRKLKEQISNTSQRALGLDGIRFNLQVALERLEKLYQIEGNLAELKAMSARIEAMSAQIEAVDARTETISGEIKDRFENTSLDHALHRFQGHQIEVASLIDVGASNGSWSKTFARHFPNRHHLLIDANEVHSTELAKAC